MQLATAVSIVAPHPVQAIAVPLLKQYAPDTLIRVPAHITLLFPFVPVDRLGEASLTLRALCANEPSFEITLRGYGAFPGVVFMSPADPEPIKALFRKIYAAFPDCPPYKGQFGDDLHPHMTVAEFASAADQSAAVLPPYEPVTFRAEQIHLMYGPVDLALPWIVYDVIPLHGGS